MLHQQQLVPIPMMALLNKSRGKIRPLPSAQLNANTTVGHI